ncbi:hypothetical protein ACO22_00405 [Paracoccidioides brasiliensis]|uniref:Uncharacterized protein n=1 Tax=Paracoccidioides brasiliensis TaxID=121759 RepID=A0A1D2JPI2_PARBR|nr:hypothetical protein ACO22_00405 [Paracoccidioides brasiliensis]
MASRIRTVLDSTATMDGRIRTVLGPKTTAESPEFQHWCKKMFALKLIDNQLLICCEGKPVAIWEKLFRILTQAHQQCQHGDLHKTSLEVERIYFKLQDLAPTTSMPPPRQSQFRYESDGSVQLPSFKELIATLPKAARQIKTADVACCSEMEAFRQRRVGAASRGLCEDLGWTQPCQTQGDATTKISTQPHREDSPSGREPWGVLPKNFEV